MTTSKVNARFGGDVMVESYGLGSPVFLTATDTVLGKVVLLEFAPSQALDIAQALKDAAVEVSPVEVAA